MGAPRELRASPTLPRFLMLEWKHERHDCGEDDVTDSKESGSRKVEPHRVSKRSSPPEPTLTIADAAARISERTGDAVSKEWVRRQITARQLFAVKESGAATAPWMLFENDVARFAEREAHRRRVRKAAIVVGYESDNEAFDHEMEQVHGRDTMEQVRAVRERQELLQEAARAVAADPDLRRAFEQLDDDEIIERTAQEIAGRVRREERIRRRAAQILADDDEHDA